MRDTKKKSCDGLKSKHQSASRLSTCLSVSAPHGISDDPLNWYDNIVSHTLQFASEAHSSGTPIVGIMCEYAPRELILAAGALPICLCGGSAETIPAAERVLSTAICPLVKSTYGYHLQRSSPFLEMADMIVGETTCDGKKKMFELMAKRRPLHLMELPQKANNALSMERWVLEVEQLKNALEANFHVEVTPAKLRNAIRLMNRERSARRHLARLMEPQNPPLSGRELLSLRPIMSGNPADLEKLEMACKSLKEEKCRKSRTRKIRVLLTGVPVVNGAERVLDLIEQRGAIVVCQENCTGVRPILQDVDENAPDPMRAIAEKYYGLTCSVMTPNSARLAAISELAADYKAECVVELIWQGCHTYDVESALVKRLCERELQLPYLAIHTDYSMADSERIAVRLDALYETVRERRRR